MSGTSGARSFKSVSAKIGDCERRYDLIGPAR